jgi:PST family polysaccharide transporter
VSETGSSPPPPSRGNLGRRFLVGSLYLGFGSWASYSFNFATQIVLARLLGPEHFGLYAFVLAINEMLNIIAGFSLSVALIQAREESQTQYDTAFAICAGLGLIGLLVAAALAPLLWVYRSPDAAWFLIVLAFGRVLRLLWQVPQARLERSLRYGAVTAVDMVSSNVGNLVAIGLAWGGIGAWSLVVRDVLIAVAMFTMAMVLSGYRFRGLLDRSAFTRLMTFAKSMFVSRSVDILLERGDRVAVGALMGNAAAGLLDRSRFLADMGLLVVRPVQTLSFNLFSRVQDDSARLTRSFGLVNYFLIRLTLVGAVVLVIFPAETVRLLLGEEWLEAAPLLPWLAFYAALFPVLTLAKVLIIARGRVHRVVRLSGALAWHYCRDLVETAPLRQMATPALLLVGTVALVETLALLGALATLPWYTLPFLPAVLFAIGVLAVERTTLIRELRYLRAQLSGGASPPSAAEG